MTRPAHIAQRALLALFCILGLLATMQGCVQPLRPDVVHPAKRGGAPRIAVLKSSANPYYDLPVELFVAQVDAEVSVFTAGEKVSVKSVQAAIHKAQPDLVLTLGTRAAVIAKEHIPDHPVLFAMVLNHQRLKLQQQPNFFGIALETPTISEFTKFKMVAPELKRVLTFYSPKHSSGLVAAARKQLRQLNIELTAVAVDSPEEVKQAYRRSARSAGGVWLLNDPVVMARPVYDFLRKQTVRDRLPFMCSLSDNFAREGALMSVSVDFHNLGSQAANMANTLLERKQTPREIGIQPPIGGKLVVNLTTARQIGLRLDREILPLINEVVGE